MIVLSVDLTTEIVILNGAAGPGLVVKVQPDKKHRPRQTHKQVQTISPLSLIVSLRSQEISLPVSRA